MKESALRAGLALALSAAMLVGCSNPSSPSTSTTSTATPTITAVPTTVTPTPYVQAPITIDRTFDGRLVHANLVKYTGSVPSANTTVTVNGIQAAVSDNGTYYAYLDLDPGKNVIEVDTSINGVTTLDEIMVTFRPPLVVRLDWPWPFNRDLDFTKVPIDITGWVSEPTATIEINGGVVTVRADGHFTVSMKLKTGYNFLTAVASLDDDVDTDNMNPYVFDDGKLAPPPPVAQVFSSASFPKDPIEVKIGENASATMNLGINKRAQGLFPGSDFEPHVVRVAQPRGEEELDPLPSLTVTFVPAGYKIYPKIEYRSLISVRARSDLQLGTYYFIVHFSQGGGLGADGWPITVVAKH